MQGFEQLLTSLASGEGTPDLSVLTKRRKNGPPALELMPSQQAMLDVGKGAGLASPYETDMQQHMAAGPTGEGDKGGAATGAAGGVAGALQGIIAKAQMPIPSPNQTPFDLDPGYEQRQQTLMPHYYSGGMIQPDQFGVVDDNKKGKNGEVIYTPPGGGAVVIPHEQVQQLLTQGAQNGNAAPTDMPDTPAAPVQGMQAGMDTGQLLAGKAPTLDENIAQTNQQISNVDQQIKPSAWKDVGSALVQSANNFFNNQNNPIKTWTDMKRERAKRPLVQKLGMLENQKKFSTDIAHTQAVDENMRQDNEFQRERLQQQGQEKATAESNRALSTLYKGKHFDPKNKLHADLAKRAGLDPTDLQGWDDRNPYTKTVAGTIYEYDRNDQTFKPSGLPVDESSTLTDYKVKMPSGEFQTFKVAQKDAAKFATQMQVLGAQIEASDRRQTKQQEYQAGENQKDRAQRQQQFIIGFQTRIANEQRQLAGDLQKTAEWKANWIKKIQEDRKATKLDDDTATQMLSLVQ